MHKRISANDSDSFRSSDVKAHETARLFDELLPWTFKCRTLIDAARHGLTAQCEELIELGVDINESDDDGNTPVWTSYFHEHLDTLFTLLQVRSSIPSLVRSGLAIVCLLSWARIRILARERSSARICTARVHWEIERW